jgi:hypothetical protein
VEEAIFIQPIDYLLFVWFILVGLSTLYVAWDQFRNNPEPAVMKWLHPRHALPRADRPAPLHPGGQGTCARNARRVHQAAVEAGDRLLSHHTTNNNVETDGGGGLMLVINVQP